MEINNSVAAWSAGLAAQRLPRWDELPDIDLYLDQVLTLLDKYLGPFLPENGGHAYAGQPVLVSEYGGSCFTEKGADGCGIFQ